MHMVIMVVMANVDLVLDLVSIYSTHLRSCTNAATHPEDAVKLNISSSFIIELLVILV